MKQHVVPQNIMSVEFKIIGDLTIHQFVYIAIAGGICFVLYVAYLPGIIKWMLIIIVGFIGILVALAKVNERPFDVWISNFIVAILLPTERVWKKEYTIPDFLVSQKKLDSLKPIKIDQRNSYKKLNNYLHSINMQTDAISRYNTKMDIEEIKFLNSIKDTIDGLNKKETITEKNNSAILPISANIYTNPAGAKINDSNVLSNNPINDTNTESSNEEKIKNIVPTEPASTLQEESNENDTTNNIALDEDKHNAVGIDKLDINSVGSDNFDINAVGIIILSFSQQGINIYWR